MKASGLAAFHPMAGMDAVCMRCGKQWLDAQEVPIVRPFRGLLAYDRELDAVEIAEIYNGGVPANPEVLTSFELEQDQRT